MLHPPIQVHPGACNLDLTLSCVGRPISTPRPRRYARGPFLTQTGAYSTASSRPRGPQNADYQELFGGALDPQVGAQTLINHLLALGTTAGLLSLPSTDSAQVQKAQTVPHDWPLIPAGVEPGDSFRLLFVTSTICDASCNDIADYNAHVKAAANDNASLKPFKGQFRALISTGKADAGANTSTEGKGVSIHWLLSGEKVADDYAGLYVGDWDSTAGTTEDGSDYTGLVWTGISKRGEKSGRRHAGASEVRMGDLCDPALALSSPEGAPAEAAFPLYAISPVLTVAEPANHDPQFAADAADRSEPEIGQPGLYVGASVTA